jgi:hypothetical protein
VILLDRESHDPMALARILAAARETPVQDQVLVAKRAWGIIADDLSANEAKALAELLRSSGVQCGVGPTAALVDVPAARTIHTVDDLPEVSPILIAVAALAVTKTKTRTVEKGPSGAEKAASAAIMMTTGLPIKIGGRKRSVEKTEEAQSLSFLADLHYPAEPGRVRIDAPHFDFSCLNERMLYQAQGNLKLLVGDLVEAAPEVWTNHGTRVLLEGKPIRTMGYASLDDLEREARWLLTLRAAGR